MEIIDLNIVDGQQSSTQPRSRRKVSDDEKKLIIRHMENGLSGKVVADMLLLNSKTVYDIHRRYKQTGVVSKPRTGGRKQRLNDVQKRVICEWVNDDCVITLEELKRKALTQWPELTTISISTIDRVLKQFHYTFNKSVTDSRTT